MKLTKKKIIFNTKNGERDGLIFSNSQSISNKNVFIYIGGHNASLKDNKKYIIKSAKVFASQFENSTWCLFSMFSKFSKKTTSEKLFLESQSDVSENYINYILKEYNPENIYIVSQSYGSAVMFDLLTSKRIKEKVRAYILLGPAVHSAVKAPWFKKWSSGYGPEFYGEELKYINNVSLRFPKDDSKALIFSGERDVKAYRTEAKLICDENENANLFMIENANHSFRNHLMKSEKSKRDNLIKISNIIKKEVGYE